MGHSGEGVGNTAVITTAFWSHGLLRAVCFLGWGVRAERGLSDEKRDGRAREREKTAGQRLLRG